MQVVEAWKAAKHLNLADGNVWVVPTQITTTTESDYMQHIPVGIVTDSMPHTIYFLSLSHHIPVAIVLARGLVPCAFALCAFALLPANLCLERSKLSILKRRPCATSPANKHEYPPQTGTFGLLPPPRSGATMEEGRRFAAYWKSVDTSFDETEITGKEVDPYVLRSVDAGIDAPYSFEHENLDPATSIPSPTPLPSIVKDKR